MLVSVRDCSAFITQCDTLIAVFGRYLLSADMGVRIIFDGVLYWKFYGNCPLAVKLYTSSHLSRTEHNSTVSTQQAELDCVLNFTQQSARLNCTENSSNRN